MIYIDQYHVSFWNKLFFSVLILIAVVAGLMVLFPNVAPRGAYFLPQQVSGNLLCRALTASCLVIYFLRLQVTVWVFQKRKWTWPETLIISVLMPLALYAFAYYGRNNGRDAGITEIAGMLLFLTGSYINTRSEYTRHKWKMKKENKGRLYTEGLFARAMHVNYFGDIVLFTGFALVTHVFSMLMIPLAMMGVFILLIIPLHDRYLENKYGDGFREYSEKTKKLIPWIY